MVGEALVPYYRQILPILNIFKNMNCKYGLFMGNIDEKDNIGDRIQFQRMSLHHFQTICLPYSEWRSTNKGKNLLP